MTSTKEDGNQPKKKRKTSIRKDTLKKSSTVKSSKKTTKEVTENEYTRVEGWTEGRYRAFVTSALRSAFRRFPNKFAALKRAGVGSKPNKKTGRWAKHYACASCGGEFTSTGVNVDHIDPVVGVEDGFVSWDVFIDRLFCPVENLQILCETCHKKKSADERSARCK